VRIVSRHDRRVEGLTAAALRAKAALGGSSLPFPGRNRYNARLNRCAGHARMKPDIHPQYKEVVFQDVSCDFAFLTRSTLSSKETIKWEDGNEYPLIKVEVSSHSHPFYTGKQKMLDTSGRVDRFRKRYQK
jgi:large subunit ribosomal protein L31